MSAVGTFTWNIHSTFYYFVIILVQIEAVIIAA